MQNAEIIRGLGEIVASDRILVDEPMSKHTTFRVGGPADIYISICDKKELVDIISYLKSVQTDYYIIGNGSNLLVSDEGYRGVILELGSGFDNLSITSESGKNVRIKATAGTLLSKLAAFAYKNELGGLEFAAGIPGSVGGAMVMNAGAYGGEMKQVVTSVSVLDPQTGDIMMLSNDEMDFSYRHSVVRDRGYIVIDAEFELVRGEASAIKEVMDDLAAKRKSKQPLEYPSAGSTFKRPEGFFAGKLIEDSGLKGYSVGGAQVSEKHSGFVINKNQAKAIDVYRLIREVQEQVYADTGVRLETEVIMLGDFLSQ